MERGQPLSASLRETAARFDAPALATWLLGFALIAYLMLQEGGFDPIVRGEVGVAVWWIVLVGVAAGVMPLPTRSRAAIALIGLLGAFTVWTGLAFIWTWSDERTATELARVVTYLGFLVLGILAAADHRGRHLLAGVTTAVGLVVALAVLSRLHPQWFPENTLGTYLPGIEIERRLAYPLGYSSAVGVLAAMAIPLLAGATSWARTLPGQVLAAAALPLAGFALVLASSGVGTGAAVVALATFIVIVPDRLPTLGTLLFGGVGTAILAAGLTDRAALDRGLPTPAAISQGDELLVIAIAVCAGVALTQIAISLAVRFVERPRALQVSRRSAWIGTGVALVVAIPIAVAAGLPGTLSDEWENFKSRTSSAEQTERGQVLVDTSSSGRYQFWQSAARAAETEPLRGIGPGTFEFYWAQDPENFGFVRDAHSLYMENLAELGWVGFGLIVALVLATLGIGVGRSINAPPAARTRIATATAAAAAFAAGAALDWIWEIAALPALFMLLAAVIAIDSEPDEAGSTRGRRTRVPHARRSPVRRYAPQAIGAAVAIIALAVIWFPLQAADDLRQSQIEVAAGNLPAALESADAAVDAQPYAASPRIQQAVVLELQGKLPAATKAAREATAKESRNWRNWATLSRLEALSGNAEASVRALREARALNPRPLGGSS